MEVQLQMALEFINVIRTEITQDTTTLTVYTVIYLEKLTSN